MIKTILHGENHIILYVYPVYSYTVLRRPFVGCGNEYPVVRVGGEMQDYLLESLKLQRIDFFIKLVAASECSDEEKRLAIQWVSELTDELMAKIRSHEYSRSMDVSG